MTTIVNRNAVITGGGSGIGEALAKELAREGARVVVADIIKENAERVAEEIRTTGADALALHCDVCERDSVAQLKRDAERALGTVTLLVANAGATSFERLVDMSDDDVDWILQVNLLGTTYCLQQFLPDMIAGGDGGHVVATASMAGMLPSWIPQHAPYSGAKMGVIGMMLNLHMELSQSGIGTTTYCPGGVATGMKANNERYRPERFGGPRPGPVPVPEHFVHSNLTMLPPESIAPMVMRGIKNNHRLVFDHSDQRQIWIDTYQALVMEAFDQALEYEREAAGVGGEPAERY